MNVLLRKIHTFLHTPRIVMKKFEGSAFFRFLPDKTALKIQYKNRFLQELDLNNPKSFNEKLQWLKLYNRRPEYTKMVDKYEAKKYVASIIGEEYIIPTYGVWDNFDDIDFETLPEQFVLKCTHGSGDVVIVSDKNVFDREEARKRLTKSLKTNYYRIGREWPYKNVKPRIIAEQYLEMADSDKIEMQRGSFNLTRGQRSVMDYKFFCFDGIVKCFKIDMDRFIDHKSNYFDVNMNPLPFGEESSPPKSNLVINRPRELETMIRTAAKLSSGHPFLRVDLYNIDGRVYFGELTLFPAGGFGTFCPEEWDMKIGEWLVLPKPYEKRNDK